MTLATRHTSSIVSRVTPKDLYDRLKDLYGGISDEKIAARVGVSTRTISRWKQNEDDGSRVTKTMELLELAGFLDDPAQPGLTAGETARLRGALRELAEEVTAVEQLLAPRDATEAA